MQQTNNNEQNISDTISFRSNASLDQLIRQKQVFSNLKLYEPSNKGFIDCGRIQIKSNNDVTIYELENEKNIDHSPKIWMNFCYNAIMLQRSDIENIISGKKKSGLFSSSRECTFVKNNFKDPKDILQKTDNDYFICFQSFFIRKQVVIQNDKRKKKSTNKQIRKKLLCQTIDMDQKYKDGYLIGFNVDKKQNYTKEIVEKLQTIIIELKFNEIAIKDQVTYKLRRNCYKIFLNACRMILRKNGKELKEMNKDMVQSIDVFQSVVRLRMNDELGLLSHEEMKNIVYKQLIKGGVYPIQIRMCTQEEDSLKGCRRFVANDKDFPWGNRYHLSFIFGDIHYSYGSNSMFKQQLIDNEAYDPQRDYIRIRVADFYILDDWVDNIAQVMQTEFINILDRINQIPTYFQKKINMDQYNDTNLDGLDHNLININQLEKFEQGHFTYDQEVHGFSQIYNEGITLQDFEITKAHYNLYYYAKIFCKQTIFKNQQINKTIDGIVMQFKDAYYSHLRQNELFDFLSEVIAQSEVNGFQIFTRNCQTPVSSIFFCIQQKYKDSLMPLNLVDLENQMKGKNKLFDQDFDSNFNKYQNEISKQIQQELDEDTKMKIGVFIKPINYYGFYGDRFLNDFLERIKIIETDKNVDLQLARFKTVHLGEKFFRFNKKFIQVNNFNENDQISQKSHHDIQIDPSVNLHEQLSFICFYLTNRMTFYNIDILKNFSQLEGKKLNEHLIETNIIKESKLKKYQEQELLCEFLFYYYNSIRLKHKLTHKVTHPKEKKYIGNILI